MRKLLIIAATTTVLAASAVSAATISGEIKFVDAKQRTITLSDGKVYWLTVAQKVDSLKIGEKVTIKYDQAGTKSVVSKIDAIK
ncbi:DUF1344 domain-containing protein [Rhizobium sp. P44RR-XXIV]|uniref:DUF1344 domain-containing protein n=1 Tax=Rhizobium sp. P44RR-XXIV TaxID=1921145 RepID=UPI0009C7E99F|nr:DUF1344 domain-containing protein [Rhizobium sp. P44RR-XXIV]